MDCFNYINGVTFIIVTQIFLFIFLLSACKPVEADDAETSVKVLCDQSLEPDVCFNCTLSDTRRKSSNVPDMTHSVIYCMYTQIEYAHMSAEILLREGPVEELKNTYEVCKDAMFAASNTLLDALMKMKVSDYKNAHVSVRIANLGLLRCVFAFRKYAINVPITPGLLEYMVQAKRLFDVAQYMFLLIDH